jgi:hypothetical protein
MKNTKIERKQQKGKDEDKLKKLKRGKRQTNI